MDSSHPPIHLDRHGLVAPDGPDAAEGSRLACCHNERVAPSRKKVGSLCTLEAVMVAKGESLSKVALAYGYGATAWNQIWGHAANQAIASRGDPTRLLAGDVLQVPIPWRVKSKAIKREADGVRLELTRTGKGGQRLSWVQTVYRHNQPIGPNPNAFCVDGCTPDDDLPFYWTDQEIADDPTLRAKFIDQPSRDAPSKTLGITRWRAIVSIAVVTHKRVTVVEPTVWGFNMTPEKKITSFGPRTASGTEIKGHLHLLAEGIGIGGTTFRKQGWTFRAAP